MTGHEYTIEDVQRGCNVIHTELKTTIDETNPVELMARLERLCAIASFSALTAAIAEKVLNDTTKKVIASVIGSGAKMPPSIMKEYLKGLTSEEIMFRDWSASLNKELHYVMEVTRTQISYIKTEMNQLHTSNTSTPITPANHQTA